MTKPDIIDALEHVANMLRHASDLMVSYNRQHTAEQVVATLLGAAERLTIVVDKLNAPVVTEPTIAQAALADQSVGPIFEPKPAGDPAV